MKLLPYTSLNTALPAMALVAVNATVMLGPAVQLAAVLAVLAIFAPRLKFDLRPLPLILLGYIAISLALAILAHGSHQAVIKAGKLMLFCLVSALLVRGASSDNRFPALVALRAFLGLCGLNMIYAIATGNEVFRGDYFIEFSIYSSYTIAILIYLARPHLTVFDRGAALFFSILCGSTTGLLVLILAELVGRRIRLRTLIGFAALAPLGFLLLNGLMELREKELTWAFLANSDRARIFTTFWDVTLPSFSTANWLFGLGPGQALHGFITPDPGFNGYLTRLGEGGVYAFCLHNEPLRLLTDFGLVGLLLVALRLWTNCSKPVLFLLGVCMLTNSYLYSFSGALIASSLFNARPSSLPEPEKQPEPGFEPSLQHA